MDFKGEVKMKFSLKDSLIENNSIRLKEIAKDWKDAIRIAVSPLVKSGAVKKGYADDIIEATLEYGPYYILVPGIAMPHSKPGNNIEKDAFSLVTLQEPVFFPGDLEVSVLLCLAATTGDTHTTVAIPQVISFFQLDDIEARLETAQNIEDVTLLLDEAAMNPEI